jgi:hypothetical protein
MCDGHRLINLYEERPILCDSLLNEYKLSERKCTEWMENASKFRIAAINVPMHQLNSTSFFKVVASNRRKFRNTVRCLSANSVM